MFLFKLCDFNRGFQEHICLEPNLIITNDLPNFVYMYERKRYVCNHKVLL